MTASHSFSNPHQARSRVGQAVHRHQAMSPRGLLERLFTLAFKGLVYPQIWEDPVVDLDAMEVSAHSDIVTIASGGCNVLSYLVAGPRTITAVDLNPAHIALTRLKLCALAHLPDHAAFHDFFGRADIQANVALYDRYLAPHLDPRSRGYWEKKDLVGRRRITQFARNFYRHGLLGRFIGTGHRLARLYGVDLADILRAATIEEQRAFFRTAIEPLFSKRLVVWATRSPVSLYGLGIPPAQFESLVASGDGDMAGVLRDRLERLACGFEMRDNYFAWQAFGRCYPEPGMGAVPPYLEPGNYPVLREHAHRVTAIEASFGDHLAARGEASCHRYVLLDAQDWMTDRQLTDLWRQITRTAAPGARVIFRTAGIDTILPGRLPPEILDRWTNDEERTAELTQRDRSSIYGGFHLYRLRG
jgi:S-adenosylmethionine-diacylglycerol 3-amino-3-carboxypropyl transferase